MSAKHMRPFYVFAAVAAICSLVLVMGIRSKAEPAPGPGTAAPSATNPLTEFSSAGQPIGRLVVAAVNARVRDARRDSTAGGPGNGSVSPTLEDSGSTSDPDEGDGLSDPGSGDLDGQPPTGPPDGTPPADDENGSLGVRGPQDDEDTEAEADSDTDPEEPVEPTDDPTDPPTDDPTDPPTDDPTDQGLGTEGTLDDGPGQGDNPAQDQSGS